MDSSSGAQFPLHLITACHNASTSARCWLFFFHCNFSVFRGVNVRYWLDKRKTSISGTYLGIEKSSTLFIPETSWWYLCHFMNISNMRQRTSIWEKRNGHIIYPPTLEYQISDKPYLNSSVHNTPRIAERLSPETFSQLKRNIIWIIGKIMVPLGWYPDCLTPPRSPEQEWYTQ